MHKPIPLDADTGEEVTVEMALEQARRAGDMATELAGALEEARALLIRVLAIEPHELEPPILKEQGDLAYARTLDRKLLEEKYVLARMATRLSMRKVHDLEGKVELLEYNLASKAKREKVDAADTAKFSARVEEIAKAHKAGMKEAP